jgi:dihydroorotase
VAIVQGLLDGTIDVVVSSHDPQDADVKRRPFAEAADGAIGLETLLAALLRLYHDGQSELAALLRPVTVNPAELLRIPGGKLEIGGPADIILLDLEMPWVVDPEFLHSKSKNTPYDEAKLQGRVLRTLVAGRSVYTYPNPSAQ